MSVALKSAVDDEVIEELRVIFGHDDGRVLPNLSSRVNRTRVPAPFPVHRWAEHLPDVAVQHETGQSSWFGFAMTLRGRLAGRRAELVRALTAAGIESRPVVAGNFLANPVIAKLDHSVAGPVPVAENIDVNGLFTGNHHYPIPDQIARLREVVGAVAAQG